MCSAVNTSMLLMQIVKVGSASGPVPGADGKVIKCAAAATTRMKMIRNTAVAITPRRAG